MNKRRALTILFVIFIFITIIFIMSPLILTGFGKFLVVDESPISSDAVVVLNTDVEYYPRLIEAVQLYKKGYAAKIVINGNRKSDTLKDLEAKGFDPCCLWYADHMAILSMFGVPGNRVITISAEDAYDTVSEAEAIGERLIRQGLKKIIITTSKFHTRRARYIWLGMYKNRLAICSVAAKSDPFDPQSWWKEGRQIRWVLAEYGAWVYLLWKHFTGV